MLNVKTAYGNDAILKRFPKPDYSHISSNIFIGDASWIPFDQILIDENNDLGHQTRMDGQDPAHVVELKLSFAAGVIVNEELGAVIFRGNEYPKPYVLKYGFGRTLSQMDLGVKGWAFNTIEGTQTEIEDACSYENEEKSTKAINKEADIINTHSKQIRDGRLANNEDIIREKLKKLYIRRKKESLDRIAAGIFATNETPQKYSYYTDSKIKLWREDEYSGWFTMGGDLDTNKKSFGFTTKIGGLYRTYHRAMVKYAETGIVSYVNAFSGQVSKGSSLKQQRASIINEYTTLRVNHAIVYGTDIKFLTLNGFFPQMRGVDNWGQFIEIDQVTLEKKIKLAIEDKNSTS